MKKKKTLLLFLSILIFSFFLPVQTEHVQASSWIDVKATASSQTKVKLSWKKKKVNRYTIYRAKMTSKGYTGYKKIATISGSKSSYVDKKAKKNTYYQYTVKAYKKSGKSYKLTYDGEAFLYTGWRAPDWEEYAICDANVTTSQIPLSFCIYDSMKIAGYEIYRRVLDTGSYKKIATIKTSKTSCSYIDKKVSAGTSYQYKIRTYHMSGKKKKYSAFSSAEILSAVNRTGGYTASVASDKGSGTISYLDIRLTSKSGNGDLVFHYADSFEYQLAAKGETEQLFDMHLKEYSTDGKNWISLTSGNSIVLRAGETIYLRFRQWNGASFPYPDSSKYSNIILECYSDLTYNRLICIFDADLIHSSATAQVNSEYYH